MQRVFPTLRLSSRRAFSATPLRLTAWSPGPAPPRLPRDEQEIFDQLQKQSTGAFSTPRQSPQINQSPLSESRAQPDLDAIASSNQETRRTPQINQSPQSEPQASLEEQLLAKVQTGKGEELHPNVRRGAPPEFEGDINPKTGEAGGPKNEPLRWGYAGDWSYNGRCTDF